MADEIRDMITASTESALVVEVAKHVAEQVHEIVKRHACSMPTVSAAIGVALVTIQQIYGETVNFAGNSMEGDVEDALLVQERVRRCARELLDIADEEIAGSRSGACG